MLTTIKIIHYLSFAIGIGGGAANLVIAMTVGPEAPKLAGLTGKRLSRVSFSSIVLLWITGVWLATLGGWSYGPVFWVKMLAVVAMTVFAITVQVMLLNPKPDTPQKLKTLGKLVLGSAVLSVILATIAFT